MGQHSSFTDNLSLETHIKSLADEELLDFWEETQYMARFLEQGTPVDDVEYNPEYERLILQELQVRNCMRECK